MSLTLSDRLEVRIPLLLTSLLLNDDFSLDLSPQKRHTLGWFHCSQENVGFEVATAIFLDLATVGKLSSESCLDAVVHG